MHWQRLFVVGRQRRYLQTLGCEYCRRARTVLRTSADISDLFQSQSFLSSSRIQTDLQLFELQMSLGEPSDHSVTSQQPVHHISNNGIVSGGNVNVPLSILGSSFWTLVLELTIQR